jgi:hypothetical protein
VNEIVVLFIGRVIFKQNVLKKHKCFDIMVCKMCDMAGCTYNMKVCLEMGTQNATQIMPAKYVTGKKALLGKQSE